MTTFAVTMVKDEADVIEGTLRHMADEVDEIIVADNLSTDGTSEILAELRSELPLTIVNDPQVAYDQSVKMSLLAALAAKQGAEWIVPFDADELWVGPERVKVMLADSGADRVKAVLHNHFPTAVDPAGANPFETIVYRHPEPAPLPKVAFRWREGAKVHQGNHGVTLPGRSRLSTERLEIRHFPYRSAEQFVRKSRNGAAAYAATDLPFHVGQHWREYGLIIERHGEEALADVFREHFWYCAPSLSGLIYDPAPFLRWQSLS